jgi:hypothetical protein
MFTKLGHYTQVQRQTSHFDGYFPWIECYLMNMNCVHTTNFLIFFAKIFILNV